MKDDCSRWFYVVLSWEIKKIERNKLLNTRAKTQSYSLSQQAPKGLCAIPDKERKLFIPAVIPCLTGARKN